MMGSSCGKKIALLILLLAPADGQAQLLAALSGHSKTVTSVSFSPDGKSLVSGSWDQSVRIWDAASHQLVATLEGHTGAVTTVAYSPDGKFIISSSRDHSIIVWDAVTHQTIAKLSGHSGTVTSVCYSPDGKTIASSGEVSGTRRPTSC